MAARHVEIARRAGLAIVQGGEKLPLARATEARVGKCQREGLVAVNRGCEVAEMLEVIITDLRAGPHQEGTQDDDFVPSLVLLPLVVGSVLQLAVFLEDLGAKAGIELLAQPFQGQPALVRAGFDDTSGMQCGVSKGTKDFEFLAFLSAGYFVGQLDGTVDVVIRLKEAWSSVSEHNALVEARWQWRVDELTMSPATHGPWCVVLSRWRKGIDVASSACADGIEKQTLGTRGTEKIRQRERERERGRERRDETKNRKGR